MMLTTTPYVFHLSHVRHPAPHRSSETHGQRRSELHPPLGPSPTLSVAGALMGEKLKKGKGLDAVGDLVKMVSTFPIVSCQRWGNSTDDGGFT